LKNCKYNIEWQYDRISLKNIKDIEEKLSYAQEIFNKYLNRQSDSAYSVINWAQGLSIAYKEGSESRTLVDSFLKKCISIVEKKTFCNKESVSSIEEIKDFHRKCDSMIFDEVVSNNLDRAIKWTKKFYIHKDLHQFLINLNNAVVFSERQCHKYETYLFLVEFSVDKKSEWKFLY
jgi:hypothetical protein